LNDDLGVAGFEVVIHSLEGARIVSYFGHCSLMDTNGAEVDALYNEVHFALERNCLVLQVEGDSSSAIAWATKGAMQWRIVYKIRAIHPCLSLNNIHFVHIFREAHSLADSLARKGTSSIRTSIF
jgi:hypothetical protein